MVRWGIMAAGNIARKFADTVNGMADEAELSAIASRSKETAEAFAHDYRIPRFYGSYEQLCMDDTVDAVYIGTPNNLHFENAMLCLEHGKHVLCEKPFTTNAQDAEKLFIKAKEKGLFIMEAFWIKHLPLLKKLQEIIADGTIGDVKHMRADYGFITKTKRRERKFAAELGGGALLDIGIYNIGFTKMIMKEDPSDIKSNVVLNEFGTDEFSTMIFEYPGNRTASLTTAIGIEMAVEGAIYGTKGSIYLPNYQKAEKLAVNLYDGESYTIEMPFEINGFEYQIREAARCIGLGMTTSDVLTMEDSLDVLKTMDRVRAQWGMKFPFEV